MRNPLFRQEANKMPFYRLYYIIFLLVIDTPVHQSQTASHPTGEGFNEVRTGTNMDLITLSVSEGFYCLFTHVSNSIQTQQSDWFSLV